MKTFLSIVLLALFTSSYVKAQVVTTKIYSKVDIAPQYQLWDGSKTMLMGYTSLIGAKIKLPSPVLIYNEGDSVELRFKNFSQGAPHTIHLHGLDVNQRNDGVPSLSFDVPHDSTRSYYFRAPHPGTYLYHCHVVSSLHVQAGMYGLLIVKPKGGGNTTWTGGLPYHKEYAWLMSEVDTIWHNDTIINHPHDPKATKHHIQDYYPQYFLVNGKSEQQLNDTTIAIKAMANESIYLRLANIGYYGNRVILPSGLKANTISSDGRPLPLKETTDTVIILPGERFSVMLNPTTEFKDSIKIEYFDLNTQIVKNVQKVAVSIAGYLLTKGKKYGGRINVFPNPAKNIVILDLPEKQNIKAITVLDAIGKRVYYNTNVSHKITINVNNWNNGIYHIQAYSDDGVYIHKLIIIH